MGEGSKDRPQVNFFLKWIKDRLWNYNIDAGCRKIKLINKTGANSIKGTIVIASTGTDMAFSVASVDDEESIGIVAEDGVGDGSECFIIISGVAEVLLKDSTSATRGYWVKTSDVAGRADATNASPPGGGIPQHDEHFQEIGHCLETVSAGTDVLAKILVHFN